MLPTYNIKIKEVVSRVSEKGKHGRSRRDLLGKAGRSLKRHPCVMDGFRFQVLVVGTTEKPVYSPLIFSQPDIVEEGTTLDRTGTHTSPRPPS